MTRLQRWRSLGLLLPLLTLGGVANSGIVTTQVSAGMAIEVGPVDALVEDAVGTNVGTTSAAVDIRGLITGARVYSNLSLTTLAAESATLAFSLGWDGGSYAAAGYMGQDRGINQPYVPNLARFTYSSLAPVTYQVTWDYGYTGTNYFGLNGLSIFDDVGHQHNADYPLPDNLITSTTGSISFSLGAGTHDVYLSLFPNRAWFDLSALQGDLTGTATVTFVSAAVPEPGTLSLIGMGLVLFFVRARAGQLRLPQHQLR